MKTTSLAILVTFHTLLFTGVGVAHAAGTPSNWEPTVYDVVGNKKFYYFWGGWIGGGVYLGSTAEDSAQYFCEIRGLGTPIHSGEYRSDGRFYFKCPGSSRWQGGLIKQSHRCNLDQQIIVIDLDVHTAGTFTCTQSDAPDKKDGEGCGVGNPCNPATGNKFQSETDFAYSGFAFTRSYNSSNLADIGLGRGWRSLYQKKLIIDSNSLIQVSSRGRGEPWRKVNGVWQGDADSDVMITEAVDGFTLTRNNGATEWYNLKGYIQSETDTNGQTTIYTYDGDELLLTQVTNSYGHSIIFTYVGSRVATVTDPTGAVYRYEYANGQLVTVVYPDDTPSDDLDNPRKLYHYENTAFPHHLTGITDENGHRYATYAYDATGKAISTEHAQTTNPVSQEKFELDYQGGN